MSMSTSGSSTAALMFAAQLMLGKSRQGSWPQGTIIRPPDQRGDNHLGVLTQTPCHYLADPATAVRLATSV